MDVPFAEMRMQIGRASARPQGPRQGWRGPKKPKESTPRSRRLPPPLLAGIGARLTRRVHAPGVRRSAAHPFGGREVHRTSLNTPPHPRARSGVWRILRFRLRCSAAATGIRKNTEISKRLYCFRAASARSIRRSGTSHIAATSTYNPCATDGRNKAETIAMT